MGSRHWENEGLPTFPKELEYCSLTGEDLEYDSQSWQAAKDILQLAPNKMMKNAQLIYDEFDKVFIMSKFPPRDKGVFGPILRAQSVLIATQQRIIAAGDQIRKALETVVTTTPASMEKL